MKLGWEAPTRYHHKTDKELQERVTDSCQSVLMRRGLGQVEMGAVARRLAARWPWPRDYAL